jgi:hypothetical protein
MQHARIRQLATALTVGCAVLLVMGVPAQAQVRQLAGGSPSGLNNNGDAVGINYNGTTSEGANAVPVLWKATGARTELTTVGGASIWQVLTKVEINDDGTVLGAVQMPRDNNAHVALWRDGSSSIARAIGRHAVSALWLGRGTDWGLNQYEDPLGYRVEFAGVDYGTSYRVSTGRGGAFTMYAATKASTSDVGSYQDPYAQLAVAIPEGRRAQALADGGVMVVREGVGPTARGPLSLLRWNPGTKKFDETRLAVHAVSDQLGGMVVNRSGRIVATKSTEGGDGSIWSIRPGAGWEDITRLMEFPAGARDVRVKDVNEWGDVLAGYALGLGAERVDAGVIYAPRAPLTGQVSNTAAASGRAARQVRLVGGPSVLTAKVSKAGMFSLKVPAGATDTLTLVAPGGSCIRTRSGCTSSAILPAMTGSTRPIRMASAMVTAPASFVARVNSMLAVRRGKALTKLRCSATRNCVATVTLRNGRTVLGTGRVMVPKGRTRLVSIKLNTTGNRLAAARGTKAVRAQLSVRSGRTTTTVVQAFRL